MSGLRGNWRSVDHFVATKLDSARGQDEPYGVPGRMGTLEGQSAQGSLVRVIAGLEERRFRFDIRVVLGQPLRQACAESEPGRGGWCFLLVGLFFRHKGQSQVIAGKLVGLIIWIAAKDHDIALELRQSRRRQVRRADQNGQFRLGHEDLHLRVAGQVKRCWLDRLGGLSCLVVWLARELSMLSSSFFDFGFSVCCRAGHNARIPDVANRHVNVLEQIQPLDSFKAR